MNNPSDQTPAPQQGEPIRVQPVRVALRLPASQPYVTYAILVVTVLVYLAQVASQYLLGGDYPAALGMKDNALIIQGQYWRLITPILLHGSLIHIGFNMWALFSFGRNLERVYGHMRFTLLYLLGGLAGNVASFLLSSNPSLGASTAIFGLVTAEAVYYFQNRHIFGRQSGAAINSILTVIGVNLILGFTVSGIDNFGHLGGMVGGAIFAFLAGPVLGIEGLSPDLYLVDRRSGFLPWLVAAVEGAGLLLIASLRIFA